MEINTCEQYVLSRLASAEEELEKTRGDLASVLETVKSIFYVVADPDGNFSIQIRTESFVPPVESDSPEERARYDARVAFVRDILWDGTVISAPPASPEGTRA